LPKPITHVQPPMEFTPPAYHALVKRVVQWFLPLLRRQAGIADVQIENPVVLAELFHQFQSGKVRFLIAFRHPTADDPLSMAELVWNQVPQAARQQGIALTTPTHAHFVYDRGIPLWAGEYVGKVYSWLGGTPIRRGKADLMGLRSIRQIFANGKFPLAAAPEGANNGYSDLVSPIEPGIAQFGFWCIEDLLKADRPEQVVIVPVGIRYSYISAPWKSVWQLLRQLEIESGLSNLEHDNGRTDATDMGEENWQNGVALTSAQEAKLYRHLLRLGEHLLTLMEQFYNKFYDQPLPSVGLSDDQSSPANGLIENDLATNGLTANELSANQQLASRLKNLLNACLNVAEAAFNLAGKGTVAERCRRIEQAGWDRIYREDLQQLKTPVERGLADRVAEEAALRLWHMRLVETFVSVTGRYVLEKPTVEHFAETTLLLWDMVTRIKGEYPFPRPKLGAQRVMLSVSKPISVSDRWTAYQTNRRQAVASLTQDLQTALEALIQTE
jgi:hypothetical protein